jgi:hypothetical protein
MTIHGGQEIRPYLGSPHIGSEPIDVTGIAVGATGPQGPAGPPGADGKTVLGGTAAPTNDLGTNGDWYLRRTADNSIVEIYGPKTVGAWGSARSLIGPQGPAGSGGSGGGLTLEEVQDAVAAMLVAGSNVTLTYNDAAGTLTLAATGGSGSGLTEEQVQDLVAAMIVAGSNVTATYNDAAGTLTLAATGGSGGDSGLASAFPVTFARGITADSTAPPGASTSNPVAYLRAPFAFTLTEVRAFQLAPDGATATIIDIHKGPSGANSTILTTRITIEANERSSEEATAQPQVTSNLAAIEDDAELWFYLDQRGDASRGIVVWLLGTRVVTVDNSPPPPPAATAPGVPLNLTVVPGNQQNAIDWDAPSSPGTIVGGTPATITDYVIQFSTNNGDSWAPISDGASSTPGPFTHTGLTNGTAYLYRVAAVNSALITGSFTNPPVGGTPAIPAGAPNAPGSAIAGGSGTFVDGAASFSWNAPSTGPTPTSYNLRYRYTNGITLEGAEAWTTITNVSSPYSFSVPNLLQASHEVQVAGVVSGLVGAWGSSSIVSHTRTAALATPTVTATPGNGTVALSWGAIAGATEYVIFHSLSPSGPWRQLTVQAGTSFTHNGATNDTTNRYRVHARSSNNSSMQGTVSTIPSAVPATPPGAPTGLTAAGAVGNVQLSWTAPTSTGVVSGGAVATITDYNIEFSTDNGANWTPINRAASTATTFTHTGLTNGTTYTYRVRAVSSANLTSGWSNPPASATPVAGAPGQPTITSASGADMVLQVAYTIASGGGAPTSMQLQYALNSSPTTYSNTISSTDVDGDTAFNVSTGNISLFNGTQYRVRVRALAGAAEGQWSANSAPFTYFES